MNNPSISWLKLLGLAICSSALLYASFFPLDLGALAWIALVPFALLIELPAGRWKLFAVSWLAGLLFYLPALQWVRVAHPMMYLSWVGLAIYCSLYFPLALFLTRALRRRALPLVLALPVVWTGLEYVRGTMLGGFPWYFIGHSQHHTLPVIQIADVTGAYGVTWLVVGVNALLASALWREPRMRAGLGVDEPIYPQPPGQLKWAGLAVALVMGGTLGYGFYRLDHPTFETGPRVALIQGNIPQEVKNSRNSGDRDKANEARITMLQHHQELTEKAAKEFFPDIIIWPETSLPRHWYIKPEEQPEDINDDDWAKLGKVLLEQHRWFAVLPTQCQTPILYGLNCREIVSNEERLRYNTALLVNPLTDPNPEAEPTIAMYHKMHRVPFGEFVPFKETLPWMRAFTPYDHDYGIERGTDWTRFRLKTAKGDFLFGVLICYEDSDPELAREYVPWTSSAQEEPVDFLINISNDGWFKGTEEHEQHLAICRFRAVEARRAVVRAVNMGISAVIDADGRVVALPGPTWRESKKIATVLSAQVPIDNRKSVYALLGDWFPALCGLVVVGWVLGRRKVV